MTFQKLAAAFAAAATIAVTAAPVALAQEVTGGWHQKQLQLPQPPGAVVFQPEDRDFTGSKYSVGVKDGDRPFDDRSWSAVLEVSGPADDESGTLSGYVLLRARGSDVADIGQHRLYSYTTAAASISLFWKDAAKEVKPEDFDDNGRSEKFEEKLQKQMTKFTQQLEKNSTGIDHDVTVVYTRPVPPPQPEAPQ